MYSSMLARMPSAVPVISAFEITPFGRWMISVSPSRLSTFSSKGGIMSNCTSINSRGSISQRRSPVNQSQCRSAVASPSSRQRCFVCTQTPTSWFGARSTG